ncbi:MAG: GAF domain-containing protein [SAR324 cluster bacterium]|nr:GAF domain-containing protein [SAR324 cluster bacterium]
MQFHFDLFIPYGIPPLLSVIVALFLASLTIKAGKYNRENQLFTLFCLFQMLDNLMGLLNTVQVSSSESLVTTRLVSLFYIFIIPVSIHLFHTMLQIQKRKWLLRGSYLLIGAMAPLTQTAWYIQEKQKVFYGFVVKTGLVYQIISLLGLMTLIYCGLLLTSALRAEQSPVQRKKIRFIFWGLFLSGMLTVIDALLDISGHTVYPLANFGFIPLGLMAYGLLRHDLMEIATEWFSQGYLSRILGIFVWWPPVVAFLFYWLSPPGIFYPDLIEQIVPYGIPQIISLLVCYSLASFCFFQGNYRMDTLLFGALCWLWGGLSLEVTLIPLLADPQWALTVSRIDHFFLVNQLGIYAGFLYYFAGVNKKWVYLFTMAGLLFMPFTLTDWYYQGVYSYDWGFFPEKNILFEVFIFVALFEVLWTIHTLLSKILATQDLQQRKSFLYFLAGGIFSAVLSLTDVPAVYGWDFYPLGNFMFLPTLIMAVGIFRYDLIRISPYRKELALRKLALVMLALVYGALLLLAWKGLAGHSLKEILKEIIPYRMFSVLSLGICLFLSFAALRVGRLKQELLLFSLSCVLLALLSLDLLLLGLVNTPEQALKIMRIDHLFVVFIPSVSLHLTLVLSEVSRPKTLLLAYMVSLLLLPWTQTDYYFQGVLHYYWGFIAEKNVVFDVFGIFIVLVGALDIYIVYTGYHRLTEAYKKRQLGYFGWSLIILLLLNLGNMPAMYGIALYPLGNFTFLPILLQGYALLQRYQASVVQLLRKSLHFGILLGFVSGIAVFLGNYSIPEPVIIIGLVFGFRILDRIAFQLLNLVFPTERHYWKKVLQDINIKLSIALNQQSVEQTVIPHLLHTMESRKCRLFFSDKHALFFQGTSYLPLSRDQDYRQTGYFPEDSLKINADHPLVQMLYEAQDQISSDQMDEWCRSHGIVLNPDEGFSASVLLQPVFFHGALICFITLEEKQNEQLYAVEEQEFVRNLASSLGPVIENIRLIVSLEERVHERTQNLQKARDQLSLINSISQKVGLALNLKEAFHIFITDVVRSLEREASGSIFLYDEASGKLVYLDSYQLVAEVAKTFSIKVNPESSYAWFVFQTQQPALVQQKQIVKFLTDDFLKMHCGKMPLEQLILPLVSSGKVAGLINISHYDSNRLLQMDEQYFLQGLARNLSHHFDMILHVEELQEREQEIAHINQIAQAVNSTLALDEVVQVVSEALQSIFEFNQIGIWLENEDRTALKVAFHYGEALSRETFDQLREIEMPLKPFASYICEVYLKRSPEYFPQITEEFLGYFFPKDTQIQKITQSIAYLLYPLEVHNKVIGVIAFGHTHQFFNLKEDEIYKIQRYVTQIATAIHNARLYEETLEHERQIQIAHQEMSHLNEVLQTVNSTLDLNQVEQTTLKALDDLFGFGALCISLIDSTATNLVFLRPYGNRVPEATKARWESIKIPLNSDSFVAKTVQYNSPNYIQNITPELTEFFDVHDRQLYDIYPFCWVLLMPLETQQKVIGTIVFGDNEKLIEISEQDLKKIGWYVAQIANALQNARIYEDSLEKQSQIEAARQEIQHMNQVIQIVNSTLDLDVIVKQVMNILQEIFEFNGLGISLMDDTGENLVFHAAYHDGSWSGFDEEKWKSVVIPVTCENSFFVKTLFYNDPNYISPITHELVDYFEDHDRQLQAIFPTKSVLFCPLSFQGKAIGVINFGNVHKTFDLTDADIMRIQQYVNQISNAVHNAQQYEALKTTKIQLVESEKIAAMTHTFEKFVPKQFLNRIAHEGLESIELGRAESDTITILFSDIRAFTEMSETMSAQELMNFLNAYLQRMSEPIHQYGGFVDKFIGDAIMALFDFPDKTDAEEAECAVKAAIAMQETLKIYNQHRQQSGYPPVASGIGIHCGPVVIGTVGSRDRMDSTVIGDNVNLASRLEGLTKFYGVDILISSDVLELISDRNFMQYRELDYVRVKGRKNPVSIFEVYNHNQPQIQSLKRASGKYILRSLISRQLSDWNNTEQHLRRALEVYPEDSAARFLLKQTHLLQQKNLPADWDGAINLDEK